MKKIFLFIIFMLMISSGVCFASTTSIDTVNDITKRVEPVLNNLRKNNNFKKNYIFTPSINTEKNVYVTNNGSINFPSGALSIAENNDLIAALLALVIARSESGDITINQWKSFVCGLGIITSPFYNSWTRGDFHVADLISIEYLVNAGYNPVALEVLALRMSGDANSAWSEFWAASPNGTHRAEYIHKYIELNYPQYLSNNNSKYYRNLVYMPCFEKKQNNNIIIKNNILKRVEKQKNKQSLK